MHKHVILVGLMGVGKTTIGKKLAKCLHVNFHDTDYEIEKQCNCSVANIYYYVGEKYFRNTEKKVMKQLLGNADPVVISTGEGTFTLLEVRNAIKNRNATTIWINSNNNDITKRIGNKFGTRPILEKEPDVFKAVEKLQKERLSIYSSADIHVSNGISQNSRSVVQNIMTILKSKRIISIN